MKKGWEIKKLADVCEFFNDGNWIESKDQSESGYRLIQTGNVGIGEFRNKSGKERYVSEETFKRLRCTEIFEGDILVSRLPDPVGRTCVLPSINQKMITAVDCTIIRLNKKIILSDFFKYFSQSQSYFKSIAEKITGTTRDRISRSNLGTIEITVPPIAEQEFIIATLDETFAYIEQAKENLQNNLQNAKELFQSELNYIFTSKGEGWIEKKLGDWGTITSSKRIYKSEYVSEGIPFYRTKEIKELSNGKEISLELFITKARYNEIKKTFGIPQIGDVLLSAVGTIGEILVIENDNEFYFKDGNIVWLKEFNNVDSFYLKYALTAFVEEIKKLSIGSAYKALTIEKLNEHKVSIPSLKEQKKIVSQLDTLSAETKNLENLYLQKLNGLEELKKSILQKAFSGELTEKKTKVSA